MPAQVLLAAFAFAHLALWLLTGETPMRSDYVSCMPLASAEDVSFRFVFAKQEVLASWHLVLQLGAKSCTGTICEVLVPDALQGLCCSSFKACLISISCPQGQATSAGPSFGLLSALQMLCCHFAHCTLGCSRRYNGRGSHTEREGVASQQ